MVLRILINKHVSGFREESLVEPGSGSALMAAVVEFSRSLVESVGVEPWESILLESFDKARVWEGNDLSNTNVSIRKERTCVITRSLCTGCSLCPFISIEVKSSIPLFHTVSLAVWIWNSKASHGSCLLFSRIIFSRKVLVEISQVKSARLRVTWLFW